MKIIIGLPLIMAVLSFFFWFLVYVIILGWLRNLLRRIGSIFKPTPPAPVREIIKDGGWARTVEKNEAQKAQRPLPAPRSPVNWKAFKPNLGSLKATAFTQLRTPVADDAIAIESVPVRTEPMMYSIAKDGEELGTMSVPAIKKMLASGGLTPQDYYLDPKINDWMPLDCLPDLV